MSLALVQEPYVGSKGTVKQFPGTRVIQCTLNRQKPVKSAIIIFGDQLRVIHDPQLITETECAVLLEAGSLKIGLVSVYFEGDQPIEPYIERTKAVCQKLGSDNIILGGDVNAWSHWWGSSSENQRGEAYSSFLNEVDFHILNVGDTPTFEEVRGGKMCTSIVDVTACSIPLLGKIKEWKVDRTLTTSDHNAITYNLEIGEKLQPAEYPTTRKYNTKKAKWFEFDRQLHNSLANKGLTANTIKEVGNGEELEALIETYTSAITEACEHAIPRHKKGKVTAKPSWWTDAIEELKRDVLRKKRRIRNAAPPRKDFVLQEYRAAKQLYAEKANEAQTESWKKFCTTQEQESMWDGIYRVLRNTNGREEDMLLRGTDGNTLSPEASANLLAETFYPKDSISTDLSYHTKVRYLTRNGAPEEEIRLGANDPPFTVAEVEAVLRTQNPKKAPGADGFTADICARAIRSEMEVFMAIANKCLTIGHFPKQWKTAHVVILRKPGKDDYTHPKSYRPIGLLSVLGKTIEKLLVGRLQWHILPTLSTKQYGFMPQRGTEDALYDLVEHIRKEQTQKKSVIIVSLDIEGAFDNAWWPALKYQLQTRRCPRNLYKVVNSYLSDRKVTVHYARASSERETNKGCVQGSIGGPTFWNLILDPLLQILSQEKVYYQAFADDVVLVFSGKTAADMEGPINQVLNKTVEWGKKNKLNFAAHKTNAMLVTKKLKFGTPRLLMSGVQINLVDVVKILGLQIDKNLNFNAHVTAQCKKAADIYKQLACAAKVRWGLNGEIIRTIYVAVIEPIMMYGANVWGKAAELQMNRKRLEAIQRGFAQKICKAYRTTSLTSVQILSGTLPLDLRIQEAVTLYKAKKGIATDYLPPGRNLEERVKFIDLPHPATQITTEYELLEDMNPQTQHERNITGPQIYTDGSKIAGGVGAALTWWHDGKEETNDTFSLDPTCTVFQSELYALHRAVLRAKESGKSTVNILSDSRSSLEVLGNPKLLHPLVKAIRESISQIRAAGNQVRLFWLRAHVGTEGNERADELAKTAASLDKPSPDYAEVPLSYVRKRIREETVAKWQDRYNSSTTGSVTRTFLPHVDKAYRTVRGTRLTPLQIQILTGHGGFGEYLHRFKLRSNPGCECDPNISESVWHIILDCPRFSLARHDLECEIQMELAKDKLPDLLDGVATRTRLLEYLERIASTATKRNSTLEQPPETPNTNIPDTHPLQQTTHPTQHTHRPINLLADGETGTPGVRLRGVALFMDNNTERVGIAFCNAWARNTVYISPGLGALLNGSTFKTTMRRRAYNELQTVTVEKQTCKIVRKNNKTIALFSTELDHTEFELACRVLARTGERGANEDVRPTVISVDAMVVGYQKGTTADYLGALAASKHHELVIYEDRGQDLGYLRSRAHDANPNALPTDFWDHPVVGTDISGSERLENRVRMERTQASQNASPKEQQKEDDRDKSLLLSTVDRAPLSSFPVEAGKQKQRSRGIAAMIRGIQSVATTSFKALRDKTTTKKERTRADMGHVTPPILRPAEGPQDHMINALVEFVAVTKATKKVNEDVCKDILTLYRRGWGGINAEQLQNRLREAEAAVYDNDTSKVILGQMSGSYMAAYSNTCGFVSLDEEQNEEEGKIVFKTPPGDPVVVVAKCTKVMLDDRILEMANTISGDLSDGKIPEHWVQPTIEWVNGVPGCGKTTWVMSQIDAERDMIVTTTTEAANDLREKLESRIGDKAKKRVRTMASLLVNGMSRGESCTHLVVDEALMNHFGSIVLAIQIVKASKVTLLGDNNQLPYIDRCNLFPLQYNRPNKITNITKQLLCTYRNPQDVAYALREVYSGIYSANTRTRSLTLKPFTGATIPKSERTLYLVHTQAEKALLISQGFGKAEGSRTMTIHEAQGQTFENVVIVRTTSKPSHLLQSVPHAVVAISRHTKTCVYYTDTANNDASARLISMAEMATEEKIRDYNLRMAIRSGDATIHNI